LSIFAGVKRGLNVVFSSFGSSFNDEGFHSSEEELYVPSSVVEGKGGTTDDEDGPSETLSVDNLSGSPCDEENP
jgi:hypothetical protein